MAKWSWTESRVLTGPSAGEWAASNRLLDAHRASVGSGLLTDDPENAYPVRPEPVKMLSDAIETLTALRDRMVTMPS